MVLICRSGLRLLWEKGNETKVKRLLVSIISLKRPPSPASYR